MSIYILPETLNSGYNIESTTFLSIISIVFAISVIVTKNPVISVLFLIGLFFSISLYLMLIGLYFIGLSYLLVYVGAISILFLFILMLINVRISELVTEGKNSAILAIISVLSISFSINKIIPYSLYAFQIFHDSLNLNYLLNWGIDNNETVIKLLINNEIVNINSKSWDTTIIEVSHISGIGNILYTNLFIFLIITSLILLLAMVGCIVITIKKTKTN